MKIDFEQEQVDICKQQCKIYDKGEKKSKEQEGWKRNEGIDT